MRSVVLIVVIIVPRNVLSKCNKNKALIYNFLGCVDLVSVVKKQAGPRQAGHHLHRDCCLIWAKIDVTSCYT